MNNSQLPKSMVNVRKLSALGTMIKLDASSAELSQLTSYLELEGFSRFNAQLKFRPWARDGVQVEGQLSASLQTQCPISLKPVPQQIDTSFLAKFVPHTSKLAEPKLNEEGEIVLEMDSDDMPDVYEGEELDAWAIAIEYLLLDVDLFVRAEGAQFTQSSADEDPIEENESPFAALQSLKK